MIEEFKREANDNMQRHEIKKSNKLSVFENQFNQLELGLNENKEVEYKVEASKPSMVTPKPKVTESINDWLDDLLK